MLSVLLLHAPALQLSNFVPSDELIIGDIEFEIVPPAMLGDW
jgi:hypothetical protein